MKRATTGASGPKLEKKREKLSFIDIFYLEYKALQGKVGIVAITAQNTENFMTLRI